MPEKIILRIREHHCVYVWCVCVWRVCAVCCVRTRACVVVNESGKKREKERRCIYIYVRNMHII